MVSSRLVIGAIVVLVGVEFARVATSPAATTGPATRVATRPVAPPSGSWDAARTERLEQSLNSFFAQADAARRKELYEKDLLPQDVGLSLEELEAMLRAGPPAGKGKGGAVRVQCDWAKDNPRGWFNLALPVGYDPRKPWPLAVAMHGSDSDGDNVVSFYSPRLNKLGCFVVYPTVTDKGRYWGESREMANVYRIVEWVARRYRIDFRRLVATGGSMGGVGTWSFLLKRPDIWSAGASVAGYPPATSGDILESIRGIPFYVLHGDQDHIPIEGPRKAVAELRRRSIEVTYVEAAGEKHTPAMRYWQDVCDWIARQPAKAWSPRPLFLPAPPRPSLWALQADPLRLGDPNDPILALIRQGKLQDAKAELNRRIAKSPDARSYVLRALASLPGLLEPFPSDFDVSFFDPKKGWNLSAESQAIPDLAMASRCKVGKEGFEQQFNAQVHLLIAKVHMKRFILAAPYKGVGWADYWNGFADNVKVTLDADPGNAEAIFLLETGKVRLPKLPVLPPSKK